MNYFEKRYNKASINQKDVKYDFWRYGNELGKKLDDAEVEYMIVKFYVLIQMLITQNSLNTTLLMIMI